MAFPVEYRTLITTYSSTSSFGSQSARIQKTMVCCQRWTCDRATECAWAITAGSKVILANIQSRHLAPARRPNREPLERLWFHTWKVLDAEYPRLSRMWVGGRVLSRRGQ